MADNLHTQPNVRLAEVIACLCITTDLAMGQPLEHGLRRALLAVWLGQELGLHDHELNDAYYVALLGEVGCAAQGAAMARFVKDEIAFGEQTALLDPSRSLGVVAFLLARVGEGDPPLRRAKKVIEVARLGASYSQTIGRDVAVQLADFLKLGPSIRDAVGQCQENWNGTGGPQHLKGEEISLSARLYLLAQDVEVFSRTGGLDAAINVVRRRAGKVYDPRIASRFSGVAAQLLTRLESETPWDAVLAAEPAPLRLLSPQEFDDVARTMANFVDMRSKYTLGHSAHVASLAETTARGLGLSESDATIMRQAGLLHDIGRAGVPVVLWNKSDSLNDAEWARVKRHPSLTELVLARSSGLGNLGTLAGLHHERLDGSGYRGVSAASLPVTARILAAADAYQTKLEPRPHRDATTREAAAQDIERQAKQRKLDRDVVAAILVAAGHPMLAKKRERPAGLSDREVEVLSLVVRGLSNREMAEVLFLSPKTVGHHIERIYDKIGASTRVGATLFALQHELTQGHA